MPTAVCLILRERYKFLDWLNFPMPLRNKLMPILGYTF